MKYFYRIKGLSKVLDSLVVETINDPEDAEYYVDRIINTNVTLGDRTVSWPVADGGLSIDRKFLVLCPEPAIREFDSTSPYGEFSHESTVTKGNVTVAYSQYENVLQITVFEKTSGQQKTLFSDNFDRGYSWEAIRSSVQRAVVDEDVEDLIFSLRDLKDRSDDLRKGE